MKVLFPLVSSFLRVGHCSPYWPCLTCGLAQCVCVFSLFMCFAWCPRYIEIGLIYLNEIFSVTVLGKLEIKNVKAESGKM